MLEIDMNVLWSLGGEEVFDVKCKPRRQALC